MVRSLSLVANKDRPLTEPKIEASPALHFIENGGAAAHRITFAF
jgi:hypothetical protein